MLKGWDQRLTNDDQPEPLPTAESDIAPVLAPEEDAPVEFAAEEPAFEAAPADAEAAAPWVFSSIDRLRQRVRRERMIRARRYTRLLHPPVSRHRRTRLGARPLQALEHTIWRRRRHDAAPVPPPLPAPERTDDARASERDERIAPPNRTTPDRAVDAMPTVAAPHPPRTGILPWIGAAVLLTVGAWVAAHYSPTSRVQPPAPAEPAAPAAPVAPAAAPGASVPAAPSLDAGVIARRLADAAADPVPVAVDVLADAARNGDAGARLSAITALIRADRVPAALRAECGRWLTDSMPPTSTSDASAVRERALRLALRAQLGDTRALGQLESQARSIQTPAFTRLCAAGQLLARTNLPPGAALAALFAPPETDAAPLSKDEAPVWAAVHVDALRTLYRREFQGSLDLITQCARSDAYGGQLAAGSIRLLGNELGRSALTELRATLTHWENRMRTDTPGLPGAPRLKADTALVLTALTRALMVAGDETESALVRDHLAPPWQELKVRSLIDFGSEGHPIARGPLLALIKEGESNWVAAVAALAPEVKRAALPCATEADIPLLRPLLADPNEDIRRAAAARVLELTAPAAR